MPAASAPCGGSCRASHDRISPPQRSRLSKDRGRRLSVTSDTLHATHVPGSDGTIDGKRIEVKTISPERTSDHVMVKSQGNFEKLLIIRIDRRFQFQGKLIDRSELGGAGKYLKGRLP